MSSRKITSVTIGFLVLGFAARVRAQEPAVQMPSLVVQAAQAARERSASSGKHPKIITNADLGVTRSVPSGSTLTLPSSSLTNADELPNLSTTACDNARAVQLSVDLQAAQQELDQLRRDLQYNPPVVSGNDLDVQNFKPGYSGFNVGSPPLLDSQPPVPGRVAEVELEQRIDGLRKALRLACEPPEAASIQSAIDDAEQQLDVLQRQFALDQDTYFSNPNYSDEPAGKAQLDAEQQQIQSLQAEIQNRKEQLAALTPANI